MSEDYTETTRIYKLLGDLSNNRDELMDMLNDVKKFRSQIDKLLPEKVDFKNKWLLPERLKTVTEITRNELSIRQQIDTSIKTEIDIRRKEKGEDENDFDQLIKAAVVALESEKKPK